MDPLSQGVFGSLFAQTQSTSKNLGKAAVIGGLAGMAPDLDVLIRSAADPLMAIEYHRHFSHSLFFIPFGGLICSLFLYPTLGRHWGIGFKQVFIWCLFGNVGQEPPRKLFIFQKNNGYPWNIFH